MAPEVSHSISMPPMRPWRCSCSCSDRIRLYLMKRGAVLKPRNGLPSNIYGNIPPLRPPTPGNKWHVPSPNWKSRDYVLNIPGILQPRPTAIRSNILIWIKQNWHKTIKRNVTRCVCTIQTRHHFAGLQTNVMFTFRKNDLFFFNQVIYIYVCVCTYRYIHIIIYSINNIRGTRFGNK